MNTPIRHIWRRLEPTALLLSVLMIPAVVWIAGRSSEREKISLEYVRLAIGILQRPEEGLRPQEAVRRWAVELLDATSLVPLSGPTRQALIEGSANLGTTIITPPGTGKQK